jgi:hypothetical protein
MRAYHGLLVAALITLAVWVVTLRQQRERECRTLDAIYVKTASGWECITAATVVAR